MNILELILAVFAAAFAINGFRRGFVKKLASMLSFTLSVALVTFTLPYVTEFLKNETPVYDYIVEQTDELVNEQIAKLLKQEETEENSFKNVSLNRADQTELIDELPVPSALKDMLLDYNNDEGYQTLQVSTFQEYVSQFIATVLLNVAAFIASVILVQIILRIAIAALDLLAHAPLVNTVNRAAGLLFGLLQALAGIWIFFMILSMLSGTEVGLNLLNMVQESKVLSALYDSNLFMQIVLRAIAFW